MASKIPEDVKRFYVMKSRIRCDEDALHEFKCHKNIAVEELPPWTRETENEKASRKAISRTLNGFLNNGVGGVAYLGVIDDGTIKGIVLSHHQKAHLVASIKDLLESRYQPRVASHRYSVEFVIVVDENSSDEERRTMALYDSSEMYGDSPGTKQDHSLRDFKYCWCDRDAIAQNKNGIDHPIYIVEIRLHPWDPADPRNHDYCLSQPGATTNLTLRPVHEDEEGKIYIRRNATLQSNISFKQIAMETVVEVKQAYKAEIKSLKDKLNQLLGIT